MRSYSMLALSYTADPDPSLLERPIFCSPVPAGFPSPAQDFIESILDVNAFLVAHPAATYYVRVSGDSMEGAGILNGDYLVVDRAVEATNGAIVIAIVDQELTVKRFYKRGGRIELRPENKAYQSIWVKGEMELIIWGVVTGVFRKTVTL